MDIQPIPTKYKGIEFRSRLEARWAVFFDTLEIRWEYEPECFDLGNGIYYTPDFKIYPNEKGLFEYTTFNYNADIIFYAEVKRYIKFDGFNGPGSCLKEMRGEYDLLIWINEDGLIDHIVSNDSSGGRWEYMDMFEKSIYFSGKYDVHTLSLSGCPGENEYLPVFCRERKIDKESYEISMYDLAFHKCQDLVEEAINNSRNFKYDFEKKKMSY